MSIETNLERLRLHAVPVATLLVALLIVWYAAAVGMNSAGAIERVLAPKGEWGALDLIDSTWNMQRPILPAPHQIATDLWSSLADWPLDSPRNLLYHAGVTAGAALTGFTMGVLLGLLLAVCIVHSRTLDKALLPWIVAFGNNPEKPSVPRMTSTIGAMARTGIVCEATIHGSSALSSVRECTMQTASSRPSRTPIAKPVSAAPAVTPAW